MHHHKNLLSGWVVIPLLLCLLMTLNPIVVVGSTTVGLPVADFSGVPDLLQLFCTGAMTAAKSTTSVSFVSSLVSTSSGNSIYSVFANNGYAAMLGPVGTMLLLSMYAGTAMSSGKLVAFSPLVQDFDTSSTNDYTTNTNVPQVYFTLPRDVFQTAALMLHFTGMEQLPSNILYLASNDQAYKISMGTWDYFSTIAGYAGAVASGINLGSSFSQSSYTSTVQSGKSTFILYTTVISNSAFSTATEQYISATVSDSVVISRNTTVSFTFPTGYLAWSQYRNAGSTKLPPSNIVTTAPVPGIESTEYTSSQAFAALQEANFASVSGNNDLNYVMTGWMSAMALIQALTMLSTNNFNSNGAMDNFYNNIGAAQSTFLVYDMVTGPMGTTCPTMAITQGVSCCQTAARSAFLFEMKQMSGSYDWSLMNEVYIYPRGQCANVAYNSWSIWSSAAIPTPYHLFGQAPTDNDMMTYMCGQVQAVTRVMSNQTLYGLVSSHSYRMYCQTTTISNIATDLSSFEEYFRVDTLGGAVADALVGSKTTGFTLDFIPQTTQPALTASNLFYLFPTLEQELYQMAVYLYTLPTPPTKVCGVIQTSTSSTAIKTLLTNTLSTFSLPFSASNVVVVTSGTLAGSIPSGCTDTFVIGIEDGDVAALVSYLQEQSSSSVYISFDDLTKYYDQFQSQSSLQQASGLTSRLVFATNLPSWTATPSASSSSSMSGLTTYEEFLQSVDTSLHTPAALRTFFAVSMFGYIASENYPTLPNLQTTMYSKSILSIGGLVFGSFLSSGATLSGESSSTAKNYGAQDIGVWSYSRVVDPTTPLLMAPSTPSLSYTSTGSSALNEFVPVHEMIAYATATSQNCVDAEESSSGTTEGPTTTTTTTTEAPPTTTPAPRESSTRSSSDTSKDETMNVLMIVLAIIAAVAWMAVLVIWLGQRFPRAVPSWTWFEGDPLSRVDSVCGRKTSGEEELRERSSDVARAPQQGSVCTLTVVDMPDAWQRWASAPVSMRRDNARFVKIVRQAIVDHQCYEVRVVCGTFVIACPSSSDAIALVRTLTHRGIDAKTTEVRMAVHTLDCSSSHVTQDHAWWCGDEAARIVLSLCGLGVTGQVLVTKATLDALGDQSDTTAMGATPCKNLRVNLQGSMELFSLPLLTYKTSTVSEYINRCSTALMIASVQRNKTCHLETALRVVIEVMKYHYTFLGADIRQLDQVRMCSDFVPGADSSEELQRLLCIDRVGAILVWKHNDMASLWGNSNAPIPANLLVEIPPTSEAQVVQSVECFSPPALPKLGEVSQRSVIRNEVPRATVRRRYRQRSSVLRQLSYGNFDASPQHEAPSTSDVRE